MKRTVLDWMAINYDILKGEKAHRLKKSTRIERESDTKV